MSTFYLLPPRTVLGKRLAGVLGQWFPGMFFGAKAQTDLLDLVARTAETCPDVYVLHLEDLPDDEDIANALVDGFGAEIGDDIIEVRNGPSFADLSVHRWRLEARPAA